MSENESNIAVVADEKGILLFGEDAALDQLMKSQGLRGQAVAPRALAVAGQAFQTSADVAASAGRWVKLTPESAGLVKNLGWSISKADGLATGVVRTNGGQIVRHLRFEKGLVKPSTLGGVAGIMTQLAIQMAISEITDYLASIDKKLSELLRDVKDQALADLIAASLSIDEALAIRNSVGTVSETTWSKVQATSNALIRAQALALQKLEGYTEKVEQAGKAVGELDAVTAEAKRDAQLWLGVLAKAVELQDKLSVLELDRVFNDAPDQVGLHQEGLLLARRTRLDRIDQVVDALTERLKVAAEHASGQKLINPFGVTHVINSANTINKQIVEFEQHLGLTSDDLLNLPDTAWGEAALKLMGDTAHGAKQLGEGAVGGVLGLGGKIGAMKDRFILDQARAVEERRGGDAGRE